MLLPLGTLLLNKYESQFIFLDNSIVTIPRNSLFTITDYVHRKQKYILLSRELDRELDYYASILLDKFALATE